MGILHHVAKLSTVCEKETHEMNPRSALGLCLGTIFKVPWRRQNLERITLRSRDWYTLWGFHKQDIKARVQKWKHLSFKFYLWKVFLIQTKFNMYNRHTVIIFSYLFESVLVYWLCKKFVILSKLSNLLVKDFSWYTVIVFLIL